jgi:Tol biopolymer transport system component
MAAPFDARRLAVTGAPVPVESGVMMDPSNGAVDLAVSNDGTLAYTAGRPLRFERRLVWFDRQGRSGPLTTEVGGYQGIDASPDGSALLVDLDAANANVWKLDLDRQTMVRLTLKWSNNQAIWTPDGAQMVYTSARGGVYHLWRERIDGVGEPEKLASSPWPMFPHDVSPDGSILVYTIAKELQPDLWTLSLNGTGAPSAWSDTRYVEDNAAFSPDGRWLAYQSAESGRPEIYAAPFPGPGAKTRVSRAGGFQPVWSRDGSELFFLEGTTEQEASRMKAAKVDADGGRLSVSAPVTLFDLPTVGSYVASTAGKGFDVLPDGRFVVILTPPPAVDPETVVVIRNGSPPAAPAR